MRPNLWRSVSVVILAALIAVLAPAVATPVAADLTDTVPLNDDFADAIVLDAPAVWKGDTAGSTREQGEPVSDCAAGSEAGTVWLRFTPQADATARVELTAPATRLVAAIHTGAWVDALTEIDCLAGTVWSPEEAAFRVEAGVMYSIALSGWDDDDYGEYTLTLELLDPPANDNFADAVVLESPASWDGDTTGATAEPNQPTPSCAYEERTGSVWFRFVAPKSGIAKVSAEGEYPEDFVIAAYRGTRLGSLTEVHCGQRSSSFTERAQFGVSEGVTYSVAVAGARRDDHGPYQLALEVADAAATPDFAEATPLDLPGTASGTTRHPANEVEYRPCSPWTRSVWYRIDPPDGEASVALTHSDMLKLGVYVGDGTDDLASLTQLDCVDAGVYANILSAEAGSTTATTFPVADGRPYYLQVIQSGWETTDFTIAVDVARHEGPANDDFRDAAPLAAGEAAAGSTLGATVENGETRTVDCSSITGTDQAHRSGTAWYQFTPATDQVARLRLSSTADLGYAVFDGSSIDDLTPVACRNRRAPGLDEVRDFHVRAGVTYRVLVRDTGSTASDPHAGRDFALKLDYVPVPGNDSFSGAAGDRYTLDGTTDVAGDTGGAGVEPGEPDHNCSLPAGVVVRTGATEVRVPPGWSPARYAHTVWYRFDAPEDGLASVTVTSESDQAVALYYGESLGGLGGVGCRDMPYVEQDTYTANIAGGRTYYVAVVARDIEESGAFTLGFRFVERQGPANDDLADAAALEMGTNVGDLTGATTELGEPVDCQDRAIPPSGTIWFRFTIAESETGLARLAVAADVASTTAVYESDGLGRLTNVACSTGRSPDSVVVPVTPGAYYLSVAPVREAAGSPVTIEYGLFPYPTNDRRTAAKELDVDDGESVPRSVDGDTRGATVEPADPKDCFEGTSTLWYRFGAPDDGLVRLTLTSATSLGIAVYEESSSSDALAGCEPGLLADGVLEVGDPTSSYTTVELHAGATYAVMVGAQDTSGDGAFTLAWDYAPAPDNDDFSNAEPIVLDDLGGALATATINGDLAGATGEEQLAGASGKYGEAHCGRTRSVGTVWYRYTPGEHGTLTLDLTGDEKTWAAVYETEDNSLTRRACLYPPLTGPVNGGQSATPLFVEGGSDYWIAVGRRPFTVNPSPFQLSAIYTASLTGPTVQIGDVSVAEGTGGRTFAPFRVSLDRPSPTEVTVKFRTVSGDATSPADFEARAATVSFPAGATSHVFSIPMWSDALDEDDEVFSLELYEANGAVIRDASASVTIIDDDDPPAVSVAHTAVAETRKHATSTMTFTLSLDEVSGRRVTVGYRTADVTASADGDYIPASGVVEFAPGETTKTVTVTVVGDNLYEGDESFHLVLSDPRNVEIGTVEAVGTIVDDDPMRWRR